jgi:hypothetical protein
VGVIANPLESLDLLQTSKKKRGEIEDRRFRSTGSLSQKLKEKKKRMSFICSKTGKDCVFICAREGNIKREGDCVIFTSLSPAKLLLFFSKKG